MASQSCVSFAQRRLLMPRASAKLVQSFTGICSAVEAVTLKPFCRRPEALVSAASFGHQ